VRKLDELRFALKEISSAQRSLEQTNQESPSLLFNVGASQAWPIATRQPTAVTSSSAMLQGEVVTMNDSVSVDVYFEYGYENETALENTTPVQSLSAPGVFESELLGLEFAQKVFYRAVLLIDSEQYVGSVYPFVVADIALLGEKFSWLIGDSVSSTGVRVNSEGALCLGDQSFVCSFEDTFPPDGFTTSGDSLWYQDQECVHSGQNAARSGVISEGQTSCLELTVPISGTLTFWWFPSCHYYDDCEFYINETLEAEDDYGDEYSFMGNYSVSAGDTLRWEFVRNYHFGYRYTALLLDDIKIIPEDLSLYRSSGERIDEIDISSSAFCGRSAIEWTAEVPPGTDLVVETNLSLDGGSTWGGWQLCTLGADIPGLIRDRTPLDSALLRCRQTLETTDPVVSPALSGLQVAIEEVEVPVIGCDCDLSFEGFCVSESSLYFGTPPELRNVLHGMTARILTGAFSLQNISIEDSLALNATSGFVLRQPIGTGPSAVAVSGAVLSQPAVDDALILKSLSGAVLLSSFEQFSLEVEVVFGCRAYLSTDYSPGTILGNIIIAQQLFGSGLQFVSSFKGMRIVSEFLETMRLSPMTLSSSFGLNAEFSGLLCSKCLELDVLFSLIGSIEKRFGTIRLIREEIEDYINAKIVASFGNTIKIVSTTGISAPSLFSTLGNIYCTSRILFSTCCSLHEKIGCIKVVSLRDKKRQCFLEKTIGKFYEALDSRAGTNANLSRELCGDIKLFAEQGLNVSLDSRTTSFNVEVFCLSGLNFNAAFSGHGGKVYSHESQRYGYSAASIGNESFRLEASIG
jgi:hypothetical protein